MKFYMQIIAFYLQNLSHSLKTQPEHSNSFHPLSTILKFNRMNFLNWNVTEQKIDEHISHELAYYTIRDKPSLKSRSLAYNKATWIIELSIICMHQLELADQIQTQEIEFCESKIKYCLHLTFMWSTLCAILFRILKERILN